MSKQQQPFSKDGNLSDNEKNEMAGVNLQLRANLNHDGARGAGRTVGACRVQSQASAMTLPDLPPDSSSNVNCNVDSPGNDKISHEIMDLIKNDMNMICQYQHVYHFTRVKMLVQVMKLNMKQLQFNKHKKDGLVEQVVMIIIMIIIIMLLMYDVY